MTRNAASKKSVFLNVVLAACFAAPLGVALDANAQNYPSKPVKLVVPWPAGAITDGLARQLGGQVAGTMGKPLIVENRAGASGTIGANFVAKSAADGYTLLIASSDTHAINPNYYTKLPYALSDFSDVMGLAKFSYTISVGSHVPANTLKEFVALAKANPGKFTYATWGNGSLAHLGTELFESEAGIDMLHVPYQGAGPGVTALISGNVDMMIVPAGTAEQHRQTGKLKILAIAGPARYPVISDVPTTAESGYPSVVVQQWFGLSVPKGSPGEVTNRLYKEFSQALSTKESVDWIAAQGGEPFPASAAQFRAFVSSESARWRKVIIDAGIQLQH